MPMWNRILIVDLRLAKPFRVAILYPLLITILGRYCTDLKIA